MNTKKNLKQICETEYVINTMEEFIYTIFDCTKMKIQFQC